VTETLSAWGIPIAPEPERPLARDSTVSALRLAMRLPVDGWETSQLIRLLRNGLLRPVWAAGRTPTVLLSAASAMQAPRVVRGVESLRRSLDRAIARGDGREAERARDGREVLGLLLDLLDEMNQPRPWAGHVGALRRLAEVLGLGFEREFGL